MNTMLSNRRGAILAADGFEQVEMEGPREGLLTATAKVPDDIPAFNRKMIEEFAEGEHAPTVAA